MKQRTLSTQGPRGPGGAQPESRKVEGSVESTKWLNEAFEIGKHILNQTPGKDALPLQSPSNRAVQGRLLL